MGFFLTLILFAGAFLLQQLLTPKVQQENARPANLGDFDFPTATQDRKVPLIVGTVRQRGPNVVWVDDFDQVPIVVKQKTLFSSSEQVVGYQYFLGIQFSVARALGSALVQLRRVWIEEDEVWSGSISGEGSLSIDEPELFGGNELGSGGVVGTVSWKPGSTTQNVNVYIDGVGSQQVGGQTPRYTGTAYATLEGGYVGNATQIAPWSFECRCIPNGLGLASPDVNGGNDANPMNWAYEILTNLEWGYGFPAADVDVSNFTTAAATLRSEGNGVSMLLDSARDASELLDEVMRQIDGVIFLDVRSGKWTVKLARDDYDVDLVPQLTSPISVPNYTPGDWADTTNIVQVSFANRVNAYDGDNATAQNMANAMIQGDGTVTGGRSVVSVERYPGVKDADLANNIAWRDLRTLSRPLIQARVVVTREFWDVTPGSVIAWTDDRHEGLKVPFRIKAIDYGRMRDQGITLDLTEDAFRFAAPGFAAPPATMGTAPTTTPSVIPADDQIAFESPRAISYRAPAGLQSYVWAGARRVGVASKFQIWQRNASGTPSGSFFDSGDSFGFMLIGKLVSSLSRGSAIPLTSLDIDPDPDAQTTIEAAFTDSSDTVDVGTNLVNLLLIGDGNTGEFVLAMSAAISAGNVRLSDVYRGVLDSVQQDHSAGDFVCLVFVGGNVTDVAIPEDNECEVKLLNESTGGVVAIGSANAITVQNPGGDGLDKRNRRPYPPASVSLDGTLFATSATLEDAGTVPEDLGLDVDFVRRDYRTGDGGDEIAALLTDAGTLFPTFPAANSTVVNIDVVDDPDGTPATLFTEADISAAAVTIRRIDILAQTDGVIPSRMQLGLSSAHDDGPDSGLASRYTLTHDFDVTSALTGDFNFGARAQAVTSELYTATAAGTYSFSLSTALPGGEDVEYRLNGGSWTQLIAGGSTSGSIVGVSVSDTIEVRHQGTAGPLRKQLTMSAAGAGQDGYFILTE